MIKKAEPAYQKNLGRKKSLQGEKHEHSEKTKRDVMGWLVNNDSIDHCRCNTVNKNYTDIYQGYEDSLRNE